jgi:hypothetical protein
MVAAFVGGLILIAFAGFFLSGSKTPYRTAPEFPVDEYRSTSSSLRGNTYRLTGSVLNSIAWAPDRGRLISVEPKGSNAPIPLVVPASLNVQSIQKGQQFHFLVEVRENGILFARELSKP